MPQRCNNNRLGCFTETVQHGKTGCRCRTMDDFMWAARNVDKLDPQYIHDYAINNYSLERASKMYQLVEEVLYDHKGSNSRRF